LQIFRAVANLLEITNHAAQFYIFCVCSSDYRVTFMQKFPCLRVSLFRQMPNGLLLSIISPPDLSGLLRQQEQVLLVPSACLSSIAKAFNRKTGSLSWYGHRRRHHN
jgi:hypothetical protein